MPRTDLTLAASTSGRTSAEMDIPSRVRPRQMYVAAVLAAALSMATWTLTQTHDVDRSDGFWRMLSVSGIEAEWYNDVADMAHASDLVVLGRIQEVNPGRVFGSDVENQAHTAILVLGVTRVLSGDAPTGDLLLEILVPDPSQFATLRTEMPTEETLFFLRNKGQEAQSLGFAKDAWEAESKYFRLVFSEGFFRNISGRVAARPGAETAMARGIDGTEFGTLLDDVETTLQTSR